MTKITLEGEYQTRHQRTVWVNVFGHTHFGPCHDTREDADACAKGLDTRSECLEIHLDFAEGEGL